MNTGSKSRNHYTIQEYCVCMAGVVVYFAQWLCWEYCFFLLEALQVT